MHRERVRLANAALEPGERGLADADVSGELRLREPSLFAKKRDRLTERYHPRVRGSVTDVCGHGRIVDGSRLRRQG